MEETQSRRPMGMLAFIVVWIGQIVSLLGSAMSGFAVTLWVYEGTEKATALALTGFFFVTPLIILSPVAGAIVDRSNRKFMMMVSDLAAGLSTVVVLALHATGNLEVWHLFITNALNGAFQTFQWPAFSAAISMMLPKEQYGRANGLMDLGGSGSRIIAPVLAGALIVPLGLTGILLIDVFTATFAIAALLFVHIPQPETTATGREAQGNLLSESFYGFRYILKRPSLLGLQIVFLLGNFVLSLGFTVYAAMILARTDHNELAFGTLQSASAIGGVVGGLAMTVWGGPKRRVHGVLGGWFFAGLITIVVGLGQSVPVWAVAGFLSMFFVPIINGSNQAIWQSKVAPDVQGRVFSIRRLIAWFVNPVSMLMAGPLVDLLLEPAMEEGGGLADAFGGLVGTGPGSGMALLFIFGGALAALIGLGGYAVRAVRDAEDILPDHDSPEAQREPDIEEVPSWGTPSEGVGWTLKRKAGAALASAALALLIVGLGLLQVKVMTASDEEPIVAQVAEVDLAATPQLDPTATPLPLPTHTPTPLAINPTEPPLPTVPPATPTAVPPAPTLPPPLVAGNLVTYTLTVVNNGPSDASGVVVSDTLPPGVIFDSARSSQGTGCAVLPQAGDAGLGEVVLCDVGNLPNGVGAAITIAVTIDPLLAGTITNVAVVGGNDLDPDQQDNVVKRENVVYTEADLGIRVSAPEVVIAGQIFSYTMSVVNNGPLDATGVTITDGLPVGVTFFSAILDKGHGCRVREGSVSFDGSTVVLCDVGALATGEGATATILVTVDPSIEGTITSVAVIGAREMDLHLLDNLASAATTVQVQANLAITMIRTDAGEGAGGANLALQSAISEPAIAGRTLTYTLVITNNGPWMATGIVIDDVLPASVTFLSARPGPGGYCAIGQDSVLSCRLGELEVGNAATVDVAVSVDPAATGVITNTVTVAANEFDLDLSDNSLATGVTIFTEADLTIR